MAGPARMLLLAQAPASACTAADEPELGAFQVEFGAR
jgi:hypothetical protein